MFHPSKSVLFVVLLALCAVVTYARADQLTATITVGASPTAAAVNPLTNKIYIANKNTGNVSVIDGATNGTTTVPTGANPSFLAVNAVTNKIYVANSNFSGTVTVIDGATNTPTTVVVGGNPSAVAVNPVTNKIYVANAFGASVTVIDGATNATSTVAAGAGPAAVAVNPVTNKIYVANYISGGITVIDGATNATSSVSVVNFPNALAVNPVTNKIYVTHAGGTVTVIDGATNGTSSVTVGTSPVAVAVNSVTNRIYVANSSGLTVIDGTTNVPVIVLIPVNFTAVAVNTVTNKIYLATATIVQVINGATNIPGSTVFVGSGTNVVAVNPVTNKIYVANSGDATVSVIDGATNTTTTVATGSSPVAVAVNQVTNKIYVVNDGLIGTVTVIDGTTNTTTTVPTGVGSSAVAVNPVTNRIYVTNASSDSVTVIDGATNTTTTVTTGGFPVAVAVNPATNKIYVANRNSGNVTVIDGATNTTTTVPTGGPIAVAVNPVTNKIYVANPSSNTITVIDGATNATSTVSITGYAPTAVAVNPLTNKIYLANTNGKVTVIYGGTNTYDIVAAGMNPTAVAVNPVTNRIYVANQGSSNITVIDGATNITSTVAAGLLPFAVAVNTVTNKIYVPCLNSDFATVLAEVAGQSIPLTTAISPLPGNFSISPSPSFTFTATSSFAPIAPPVQAVYYQFDTWQGAWQKASGNGPYSGTSATLGLGTHVVYAFAVDGEEATSVNTGPQSSPLIGQMAAYAFTVISQGTTGTQLVSAVNPAVFAQSVTFTATISTIVQPSLIAPTGSVTFRDGAIAIPGCTLLALSGAVVTCTASSLATGSHAVTATFTGDSLYLGSTSSVLLQTIQQAPQAILFTPIADHSLGTFSFNVSATGGGSGNPVVFTSSTSVVCVTGGVNGATIILFSTGTCSITANQTGNPNYLPALQVTQSFFVGIGQTITFTPLPDKALSDPAFALVATGGASGNPVTFVSLTSGTCVAGGPNGTNVVLLALGPCTIHASQAGNASYYPAPSVDRTFTVGSALFTLVVTRIGTGTGTVTASAGAIDCGVTCSSNYASGTMVILTAATANGSSFAGWMGCDSNIGLNCTISTITAPRTVTATFNTTSPTLALVALFSRKIHGVAGPFDLAVATQSISGPVTVEPRAIGTGHIIVFQFDAPIVLPGTAIAMDSNNISIGATTSVGPSGSEVLVTLTGVADNSRAQVSLTGVNGTATAWPAVIGFLVGDVNNTRSVNSSDISGVKARSGQSTDITNFKFDVNASGAINSSDISAVKARSGLVLAP